MNLFTTQKQAHRHRKQIENKLMVKFPPTMGKAGGKLRVWD